MKNIKFVSEEEIVSIQKHRFEDNWSIIAMNKEKEEKRYSLTSDELVNKISKHILDKEGWSSGI